MPALKVLGFDGLVPRTSATMLADNQAQVADNVKLYSQELRSWRGPALTDGTATFPQTIYKFYNSGAPLWLKWSTLVDVVPGPLADVSEYRLYLTGNAAYPQKTNLALLGSSTYYRMGVPAPTGAPSVAPSGGTGTAEDRVYVYTYLATFGTVIEESAPSPASALVSVLPGGTVTVGTFTAPPGGYNITGRRIYRSVAGLTTDSYEFVAEISLATISYADSLTVAQLGEALGTIGWTMPPDALTGLVALPGGYLAGFVNNTVYFSEPFFPHAWPARYGISIPFKIIGLAAYGSSLVVMTEKNPYIINGSAPGFLSAERVPMEEPCVAKQSIASDQDGVVYASPNGLIGIGSGFRGNLTRDLFTRDEWQAISPGQLRGAMYASQYFGIFPALANGRALVLNRGDKPALSRLDMNALAVHIDARESSLYFADADDGMIYQADADDVRRLSYVWRSKRIVYPQATSWSAVRLDADFDQLLDDDLLNAQIAAAAAHNAAAWGSPLKGELNAVPLNTYDVNGSTLQNVPLPAAARSVQLLLYSDGSLAASLSINSMDPVRLPAFKGRTFEFELAGNLDVRAITFGTTVAELFG